MKKFPMFVVALFVFGFGASASAQNALDAVLDSKGCVRFVNAPKFSKVSFQTKGTSGGWATRSRKGCYKPSWNEGKATILFQLFKGRKALTEIKEKDLAMPATTTTTTTTTSVAGPVVDQAAVIISLQEQVVACKAQVSSLEIDKTKVQAALDTCLKARVKSLSDGWWRTKKRCVEVGKPKGMVWKGTAKRGYCDCPGGNKDWDKSKGRCIASATGAAALVSSKPVNLNNVIPEFEALKKVVAQHGKRLDKLETVVYKEHTPAIKKLQDDVNALKTKGDAPHTHTVTPGSQITGPSVMGTAVRSFFFGPRIGGVAVFSAKPADNLGYGVLGLQLLHRSVEYAEMVVGLEIGTDFTKKPYFGFEVAVQFKLAERFLLGVSGRYETFGLTAHLGGEQGRGLSVGPRIVVRAMSVMDVVLTINAGLHTQPVGWVETLATRLNLEFNF